MNEAGRQLLDENILASVATVNADGSPWSTPVHLFADNEAVYWFSVDEKQHSRNITRDARVSVVIWSPDESRGPKGVYFNGVVERLDDEATAAAKELVVARLGKVPPVFETAHAYRLPIGHLDADKSTGNCWYFYS